MKKDGLITWPSASSPYLERPLRRASTPKVSRAPRTTWYRTPGRSRTRPPRTNTMECSCKLWPSPPMYAVTSLPLERRTRQTFRSAEFGFLGSRSALGGRRLDAEDSSSSHGTSKWSTAARGDGGWLVGGWHRKSREPAPTWGESPILAGPGRWARTSSSATTAADCIQYPSMG